MGEGVIVPIFKGGTHEVKNFRGITLNKILSKMHSKLKTERLNKRSNKNDNSFDNQYGFQKNKSTIDFIFVSHAITSKTLACKKKKLHVAYLDLENVSSF